jgi:hypothetical protein
MKIFVMISVQLTEKEIDAKCVKKHMTRKVMKILRNIKRCIGNKIKKNLKSITTIGT